MSWTKRQMVTQAYEEIGYAGYVYDLEPEQLQSALRRLDSLAATWNGKGISLSYPLPPSPEASDLDEETNVPDWAADAMILALAMRLAPTVGKVVPTETRQAARDSYRVLLQKTAMPNEMSFPNTLPAGAGNRTWRPFLREEDDGVILPPDEEVTFNG